ncbi:hypothetical protein [Nocardioides salsibiostraticola]
MNDHQPTTPPPSEPPAADDVTSRYPAGSPPPSTPPPSTPPPSGPPAGLSAGPRVQPVLVAHVVALMLIVIGVIMPLDQTMALRTVTAWAVFAILAALVQLTPLLEVGGDDAQRWLVGAVGTAALILFWVAVVQPVASSTTGFVLTMGVVAAAVGTFTSPHRRWPAVHGR